MECMRCGKETKDKNVFCSECLADMDNYPVKPGTVIHIPPRRDSDVPQQRKKKDATPEELLAKAHKDNDVLKRWLLVLVALVMILGTLLYFSLTWERPQPQEENSRTRNYTVIEESGT